MFPPIAAFWHRVAIHPHHLSVADGAPSHIGHGVGDETHEDRAGHDGDAGAHDAQRSAAVSNSTLILKDEDGNLDNAHSKPWKTATQGSTMRKYGTYSQYKGSPNCGFTTGKMKKKDQQVQQVQETSWNLPAQSGCMQVLGSDPAPFCVTNGKPYASQHTASIRTSVAQNHDVRVLVMSKAQNDVPSW